MNHFHWPVKVNKIEQERISEIHLHIRYPETRINTKTVPQEFVAVRASFETSPLHRERLKHNVFDKLLVELFIITLFG